MEYNKINVCVDVELENSKVREVVTVADGLDSFVSGQIYAMLGREYNFISYQWNRVNSIGINKIEWTEGKRYLMCADIYQVVDGDLIDIEDDTDITTRYTLNELFNMEFYEL